MRSQTGLELISQLAAYFPPREPLKFMMLNSVSHRFGVDFQYTLRLQKNQTTICKNRDHQVKERNSGRPGLRKETLCADGNGTETGAQGREGDISDGEDL